MELTNKVVLITGASSGVGAATALHFSKLSARLALAARNTANLNTVAEQCFNNSGIKPLVITADLTDDQDVARIVATVKQHYGRLDTLVNNAGIYIQDQIMEATMKNYDLVMATNVRSVFNLTRQAVPLLLETRGNIVNISSIVAVKPIKGFLSYGMTKAALDFFTKALAVELGPKQVRVNGIHLGCVETNFFSRAGLDDAEISNIVKSFLALLPLAQAVEGEDVGKLIAYLASDSAKSITGANLNLDCGFLAT